MIRDTIAVQKGLRAEFLKRVMDPANLALISKLATIVPSSANSETYAWFGELPQMEEFKDEVKYNGFSDATYTITNKTFTRGVKVLQSEIDDDQIGIIMTRVRQLADRARKFPLKLLFDTLVAGETGLGYDGVAFYSSSHPARGKAAAQDNLLDGTGVSAAALETDLGTAITTLKNFVDEANEPYHEDLQNSGLVVVCGTELEQPFRKVLGATDIDGTTNTMKGQVGELVVSARYTGTNDWDLLATDDAVKPLVFQEREALTFAQEGEFDTLVQKWRAKMRGNSGYGMWQNAVRTKNV